nr:uncharacterized protein LOC111839799 [Paramormyrops kingsleyae]
MVSSAFILWGVTEGSTEEAVTCTAISMLCILVLINMAPYQELITGSWQNIIILTLRTAFPIIVGGALTGAFIEFSGKYSPDQTEKTTFGGMFGGIMFVFIFFVILRIVHFVVWTKYSEDREKRVKVLDYVSGITGIIFLVIMASSIIAVSVYLAKYSNLTWKEQLGTFSTLLMFPVSIVLFTAGLSVFRIIRLQRMGRTVQLRDILVIISDFLYDPVLFNMLFLAIYSQLFAWINNTFKLEYTIPTAVAALGICACINIKHYLLHHEKKRLEGFYYFAQKILLGFFFMLHLILSFLYLSVILENDKGRPVKICEFVFLYILIVTLLFVFWKRKHFHAKPRKYVYFSGAFGLPLLNSVALAVALKLKADTGKQPVDLRLIVLTSGSVFLFGWFVTEISVYWLDKKEKINQQLALGLVERHQDPEPDQDSRDNEETKALSPIHPNGPNTEEGSCENQEMEASSPADHNEPNAEEVLLGEKNTEV